jgi:sortase B
MKTRKVFALMILLPAIGVMCYAGFHLLETQQIYQESNSNYEYLRNQVRGAESSVKAVYKADDFEEIYETDKTGDITNEIENKRKVYIPKFEIDFGLLKTINKDAAAWLYCPDTVIDYPVMKADDYSYYLNHLPDGTANANGSLFIDYNCASDFSEPLTVVYGHHMKSGTMFGSLVGYKDQKYYEEHPFMYLYTEQGNYRIEIMYGCLIGAGQWRERAFMYAENIEALLDYAAHNTTFESDVKYEEGDRIIALSTCSYEFNDARYVVIGILKSEY